MCAVEGIFSLRIVTADFYMEKPKSGLDPCFIEFRSKDIKKVPVIRIFGSSAEGQKTCMHVHGIFPYLYIPYDKKDFETLDKAIYLIASSIDKAINISLGQGSSESHHVFKIQLVKGIPFYGYHKKEHQYLKIYMLNPRFIRRTATLLQNGAIMGKIFQPHESHVPYILQFFIDYNLYGMSFLHVPKEVLKFRRKNEDDVVPYPIQREQLLDCNTAEKISTSELELDIGSGFILNRFQLITKTGTHSNPGIESIWQDERIRREKLSMERSEVPPLEIPISQDRPNVKPTESHEFYRNGLIQKLHQLEETSMDVTINATLQNTIAPAEVSVKEKKRTFNLKKLIANAVYPEECTQSDVLTNASFIADHYSSRNIFHNSIKLPETSSNPELDDVFMDDTIVDEELVLSLTQPNVVNQSLREEDMELLDVMQQLEDGDGENEIDLDSTLAPLSQNLDLKSPPNGPDRTSIGHKTSAFDSREDDSDTECLNDFSVVMDDMDELLLRLSQPSQSSNSIPQYDGADDILRTPTKSTLRKLPATPKTPITPKTGTRTINGSPKTPKSIAKKYAPLPLIIQSRSLKKNLMSTTKQSETPFRPNSDDDEIISNSPEDRERSEIYAQKNRSCLRKKLALTEMRRKSISSASEVNGEITPRSMSKRRKTIDLDKTHITCNLRTPRRRNEKRLKVYSANALHGKDPIELGDTTETQNHDLPSSFYTENQSETSNLKTPSKSPRVMLKKCPLESENFPNCNTQPKECNASKSPQFSEHLGYRIIPFVKKSHPNKHSPFKYNEDKVESRQHMIKIKSPKKFSPNSKSPKSNECDKPVINNNKMSPTVVLRRAAIELGTPHLNELSKNRGSQHKTSPAKSSSISYVKKRSTSKKASPKVVPNRKKMPIKLHNNSNPEGHDLSDTSAAEHELSKSNSINELNISSVNESKKSPQIVLRKISRIKVTSLEDIKSANILPKENKTSKRTPRFTSHEMIKEKKAKGNIKRIDLEQDYSSCDNVEDNLALSKLKKSFSSISTNIEDNLPLSKLKDQLHESITSPSVNKNKSKPRQLRIQLKRAKIKEIQTITPVEEAATTPKTPNTTEKPYSFIVDNKYEITPIAGPSHLDRYKIVNINSRTPKRSLDVGESDYEDDPTVHSFYEKSFIVDSPVFSEISVPSPAQVKCNQQTLSPSVAKVVIITPRQLPETYEEVQQNFKFYDIPDMVHKKPFYSNYADVTQRKEVGHTVLCIPGKSHNDVDDFQSTISELEGFASCRKKMMKFLGVQTSNEGNIREYLSTGKTVLITPCKLPPTKQDAKVWVKARELLVGKHPDAGEKETAHFEEDSPIKIHRKKVVMLMENESGESGEDMDCSMRSITMTPLTPTDNKNTETPEVQDSYNCTPVTGQKNESKSMRKRRPPRAKVSLSQKLKDICISNALEKCIGDPPAINCVATENLLKTMNEDEIANSQESSKSNETVTSEAVLAELEKSSFVKNLHDSQGSLDASFGLSIASLNNTYGFKVNLENLQQAKADVEHNYLTTLSLELFVLTREDLLPDPALDAIMCIFYAIENSIPSTCTDGVSKTTGVIIVADGDTSARYNGIDSDVEIKVVSHELEGLAKVLELCAHWDPDIFVGYEIEMSSWGYLIERGKHLNLNIAPLLSRVPSQKVRDFVDEDRDQMTDLDVETKLCGRILLDVWRLMRSEIALTSYTFENVMYHILHRRCPLHTHKNLTQWFKMPQTRWIVLEYYLERVRGTLELLDQLDLIGRTGEMAKLIGIQFYEVLSRGSQFRVESMMLRIAKPRNLVPISPSVQQRAHMRAPEYLALILEPQSRFYPDPVIVLDFQSLYPSIIMAYNYCFSTCLGRVEHLGQSVPFEFGASQLRVSPTILRKLLDNDLVTISPCGAVFVKREIREGILPRMLTEVLDTRQMVKQSMKVHKNSTALQRILHSRQLGLKLIANVTYGYTAANFSGRMPCVEVGDSVVSKGRETLERAIKLVEANEQWNVKVVYGDTDSLFVLVPGRSRAEAFKIGAEIAELVTEDNPHPVKLKLEKVYQPCILQTKKRYVGYMYESPDQAEPVYEAKGIETVRRDGCPAAAKMLEKCLRILFESADVSQVKNYVCRQFTKLLSGKANIQDLIFAKEFRGLNGYKPTACVPALELTRKWMQIDPRKIPRRGERVPFIVTNGPPGLPLIKLVRSPHDVLADEGLKINAIYYITKAIIPPLNRCFLLIGADVNEWFTNLPRKILFTPALSTAKEIVATNATKKSTISQYFSSTNCIIDCGRQTKEGICTFCEVDATKSVVTLEEKISKLQRGYRLSQMICQACCGRSNFIDCASLDCPVLYVLEVKRRELSQVQHYQSIIDERY